MPNLKFKQLLVLSNSERAGSLFQFSKKLNLITANDNNVGKSTLAKLLFWTFGCEPAFDSIWTGKDCKTILQFEIGTEQFEVYRYKTLFRIKDKQGIKAYPKVTGEFSERIADLLSFKISLKSRGNKLETPPPAYFFLPSYIDQKKSWSNAWDNFENLAQYADWKETVIKYHVGLLKPEHFEIEEDKHEKKEAQTVLKHDVEKLDIALTVVQSYTPEISDSITTDIEKFSLMKEEIQKDLYGLAQEQENVLDQLSKAESDKAFLVHQKSISEQIIRELESDYKFAVENIQSDEIECPLCGTVHENSIVQRTTLMTDKQQAEQQLQAIISSLDNLGSKLEKLNSKLEEVRSMMVSLQLKYDIEGSDKGNQKLNNIIENIAGKSIQEKVIESKKTKLNEEDLLKKEIKALTKEQKELEISVQENINNEFLTTFIEHASFLRAEDINFSNISSPTDYRKVIKEGGAAENSRAMLAYYTTIFALIDRFGNEVKAPFVIDTPNQHEQSRLNYDKIIDLITQKLPASAQIILCAMENEQLQDYRKEASIITLTGTRLLDERMYAEIKPKFDAMETGREG